MQKEITEFVKIKRYSRVLVRTDDITIYERNVNGVKVIKAVGKISENNLDSSPIETLIEKYTGARYFPGYRGKFISLNITVTKNVTVSRVVSSYDKLLKKGRVTRFVGVVVEKGDFFYYKWVINPFKRIDGVVDYIVKVNNPNFEGVVSLTEKTFVVVHPNFAIIIPDATKKLAKTVLRKLRKVSALEPDLKYYAVYGEYVVFNERDVVRLTDKKLFAYALRKYSPAMKKIMLTLSNIKGRTLINVVLNSESVPDGVIVV